MAHNHSHHHHHSPTEEFSNTGRLFWSIILNFLISLFQIMGGIFSGSLALISDALHNLSDGVAILISYAAIRISKRPTTEKYTFGLKRAEILAATINSGVLIGISFFLFIEAYKRLVNPEPTAIQSDIVIAVATIGLIANILVILLLRTGSKKNMNIRAAYMHMLSDALTSFAVILGGLAIYFFQIFWVDAWLTILISLYLLKESFEIIKEATNVLMMGAPDTISIENIQKELEMISGISNIHHVHIWKLNDQDIHFEAHIDVPEDMKVCETTTISNMIEKKLEERYQITHVTLQFENAKCKCTSLINHEKVL